MTDWREYEEIEEELYNETSHKITNKVKKKKTWKQLTDETKRKKTKKIWQKKRRVSRNENKNS